MASGKRAGRKSQQQNDFLEPKAPINVSATDVGTSRPFNDGAANVSFSLPADSPAATSYTVTATASGQTTRTASGSASPITVTGLASSVSYTITVTASNASGTSLASSSVSVTATTVPATMSAPTATAGVNQDTVSWTTPSNGGKTISLYRWTSSDGKTGTTTSTSVVVSQEGGTAQTYQVRAENANGAGEYSPNSNSVTTQSPFFPPFFPFFPSFGPFFPPGFGPFFPPSFGPFFPPSFGPWFPSFQFLSIGSGTLVLTPTGYVEVSTVKVGDKLVSLNIEELTNNGLGDEILTWSSDSFTVLDTVETEVVSIVETQRQTDLYQINSDWFTGHHDILVRKDGVYRFATADSIDTSYEVYSYVDQDWKPVQNTNVINGETQTVYTINCEPYDIFFTQDALVYNLREFND